MTSFTFEKVQEDTRDRWYRVVDGRYAAMLDEFERPIGGGGSYVSVRTYPVVRETPRGVWLESAGDYGQDRFVLRDARKRFACPTLNEALESFRARKERQLKILTAQIRHVRKCLEAKIDERDCATVDG